MLSFFARLPEIAQADTRCLIIPGNDNTGRTYGFVESYCDDKDCDCRRVFINVISVKSSEILATISYGWESKEDYNEWFGGMECSILEDFARPNLAPGLQQSKYAADFLRLFKVIIKDEKYVDRY